MTSVSSELPGGRFEPEDVGVGIRPGLVLNVRRFGVENGGVPFLLVHGLASNARMWDGVAAALAALGHRAVAVDQRGHGRSDTPDDGYDFATVTEDLALLIAAEGLDRPVVAGQSWGGNVVVELALRYPDAVRGVVAVDGGMIELSEPFPVWEDAAVQLAPPELLGMRATRIEGMMRAAHPTWPESGIRGSMGNFEVLADGTIRPWLSRERHMKILRELWEHRPSQRYAELTTPLLIAPAANDNVAWTNDKRRAVEVVAGLTKGPVRVEWFDPADHDLHAQFPGRLAQLLHDWAEVGLV